MSTLQESEQSSLLRCFAADERGATAVEYALLAILLGVPLLAATTPIREALVDMLTELVVRFAAILAEYN